MKDFLFYYSSDYTNSLVDIAKNFWGSIYGIDKELSLHKFDKWGIIGIPDEDNSNLDQQSFNIITEKSATFVLGFPLTYNKVNTEEKLDIEDIKTNDIDKIRKTEGHYLIINYDEAKNKLRIISSKLGMYSCYYIIWKNQILVSSRLTLISRILPHLEIDNGVIAQFCLYNYIISDKTFFKDIFSVPSASIIDINLLKFDVSTSKYWQIDDELINNPLHFKESVKLLDVTLDKIFKDKINNTDKIGISLTGGWDGRLLLAYASKYASKDQLLLYSFGTLNAPDVYIPIQNAKNLNYSFLPINLDEPEYEKTKLEYAKKTVYFSDGLRSLKRGHYLYSMQLLQPNIDYIISGIGGSNLIKSGIFHPSNVFNKWVLELIFASNPNLVLEKHFEYLNTEYAHLFPSLTSNDFIESFESESFESIYNKYSSSEERMASFLISDIERKYFGSEILSYKHVINNFSPFFDIRFIKALMKTSLFGFYKMNNSKIAQLKNGLLYAKLVYRNYPELAKQKTDRGFALYDLLFPFNPRIALEYWKMKRLTKVSDANFFNNKDIISKIVKDDFNDKENILNEYPNNEIKSNYVTVLTYLNNKK